ncbi:hypothetical protein TRFO_35642 [Tritrichomonas foetus]|uniref:Uncharacterized protein n=1 Tax=Tritrichomonas foetus TaxID=1144522 RepID=A0A1J4JKG1_9EUKA|nr:hypothetical protein TRFO_35642 [Tritrichomonas foetus]|eukprot:OHS98035.1 hypothetical protein TRFO_35642 [Tritrichomonas foetus]
MTSKEIQPTIVWIFNASEKDIKKFTEQHSTNLICSENQYFSYVYMKIQNIRVSLYSGAFNSLTNAQNAQIDNHNCYKKGTTSIFMILADQESLLKGTFIKMLIYDATITATEIYNDASQYGNVELQYINPNLEVYLMYSSYEEAEKAFDNFKNNQKYSCKINQSNDLSNFENKTYFVENLPNHMNTSANFGSFLQNYGKIIYAYVFSIDCVNQPKIEDSTEKNTENDTQHMNQESFGGFFSMKTRQMAKYAKHALQHIDSVRCRKSMTKNELIKYTKERSQLFNHDVIVESDNYNGNRFVSYCEFLLEKPTLNTICTHIDSQFSCTESREDNFVELFTSDFKNIPHTISCIESCVNMFCLYPRRFYAIEFLDKSNLYNFKYQNNVHRNFYREINISNHIFASQIQFCELYYYCSKFHRIYHNISHLITEMSKNFIINSFNLKDNEKVMKTIRKLQVMISTDSIIDDIVKIVLFKILLHHIKNRNLIYQFILLMYSEHEMALFVFYQLIYNDDMNMLFLYSNSKNLYKFESNVMSILYYYYKKRALDISHIHYYLKMNLHVNSLSFIMHFWFWKEIEDIDKQLSHKYVTYSFLDHMTEYDGRGEFADHGFPDDEFFLEYKKYRNIIKEYDNLKANGWEKLDKIRNNGILIPQTIENYLYNDDVTNFQKMIHQFNINIGNYKIHDNIYLYQLTIPNLSLYEAAIVFGSIKCFKYLILNYYDQISLNELPLSFAVQGGNLEILHLLIQHNCNLDIKTALHVSMELNNPEIFDWLMENYNHDRSVLDNQSIVQFSISWGFYYGIIQLLNDNSKKTVDEVMGALSGIENISSLIHHALKIV